MFSVHLELLLCDLCGCDVFTAFSGMLGRERCMEIPDDYIKKWLFYMNRENFHTQYSLSKTGPESWGLVIYFYGNTSQKRSFYKITPKKEQTFHLEGCQMSSVTHFLTYQIKNLSPSIPWWFLFYFVFGYFHFLKIGW